MGAIARAAGALHAGHFYKQRVTSYVRLGDEASAAQVVSDLPLALTPARAVRWAPLLPEPCRHRSRGDWKWWVTFSRKMPPPSGEPSPRRVTAHSAACRQAPGERFVTGPVHRWRRHRSARLTRPDTPVAEAPFLITTEQRIWVDERGVPLGGVPLSAFAGIEDDREVTVLARIRHDPPPPWAVPLFAGTVSVLPMGGSRISLPPAVTLFELARRDAVLAAYLPGVVSFIPLAVWLLLRKPIAVVAVGDAAAVLDSGAIGGLARWLASALMPRMQRIACARAYAARYVTEAALQTSYPPGKWTVSFRLSDVSLSRVEGPKIHPRGARPFRIVTVGSLVRRYKGVEDLLAALSICRRLGIDLELTVVGDGAHRAGLEEQARSCDQTVRFVGHLSREGVQSELRNADLFVLASWTEGQPRALLEAMATGLPAVATRVGGIPELLDSQSLVNPREPEALAAAIATLVREPDVFDRLARVSSARAADFLDSRTDGQHRLWLAALSNCRSDRRTQWT